MVEQKVVDGINNILNSTDEKYIWKVAWDLTGYFEYSPYTLEEAELFLDFALTYTFGDNFWREAIFQELIQSYSDFEKFYKYVEYLLSVNLMPTSDLVVILIKRCINYYLKQNILKPSNVYAIKYLELFIKIWEQVRYFKYDESIFQGGEWTEKAGYDAIEFITNRLDALKNLHFDLTGSREFYDDTTIYSFYDLVDGEALYQRKLPMINALKVLLVKAKEITKVT